VLDRVAEPLVGTWSRPTSRELVGLEQSGDAIANWLPAPDDAFTVIVRAYVPSDALLDGSYALPNIHRQT
jgi:hypothetical protein